MELKKLADAIDAQVTKGNIIEAFEAYAADNCITWSNEADKTTSKAQKMEALRWFFGSIATTNKIERIAVKVVNDEVTDSQFVFDFTDHFGNSLRFNEVIRRTWKNGKLVEELYLDNQHIESEQPAPAAANKSTKTTAVKKATPAPAKKVTAEKAPKTTPVKKEVVAKAPKAAPAKADDLTLIEGVGPKIAELLVAAGISTFAQLASAKPAAIKSILDAAGKRYQMHDPATWPKQAGLARDGKSAELAKLQEKLKGGK